MNITIRKAVMEDYNRINELYWQSDKFHYENEPYIYEKTNDGCRSREYIESVIYGETNFFIIIENDIEIIGFLYAYEELRGKLPFHRKRKILIVDNIVVDERHQNKGYGKKLLDYTIKHSKDNGYNDILLNVYCFNEKAIKLYEEKGFEKITQDMILKI